MAWPPGNANAEVHKLTLLEANSKPHDIVISTYSSATRGRSGLGVTVQQGVRIVHENCGAYQVKNSSLTMEEEAVTHAVWWLTSQSDTLTIHFHKKWSLRWAAPSSAQPCTVFGRKEFCGSTALATLESEGMNGR